MKRPLALFGLLGAVCLAAFRFPSGDIPVTPGTASGGGNATITWPLAAPADSVSAPDYAWNGNASTGLYAPVSGAFAATVGGNEVMRWSYDPVNGAIVSVGGNFFDAQSGILRFGTSGQALMGYSDSLWVRSADGTTGATLKAKNIYTASYDATSGDALSGLSGNVSAGGLRSFRFNNSSRMTDLGDGAISMTTNAAGAFGKLVWGPAVSTVPMLKATGTTLSVRLGDDSGLAPMSAAAGSFTTVASSAAATLASAGVTGAATVGTTLGVTGVITSSSRVQNANGTLSAPAYGFTGSATTGLYIDATTNSLNFGVNAANAAYVAGNGELALPLSNTTFPNNVSGIRLGNLDSTGIKLFRNGSGILQVGLADGSSNGMGRAYKWQSTNPDGSTQFGSAVSSDITGMRLAYDTTLTAANMYAVVAQQRVYSLQKSASYTIVKADSGRRISNVGATAQTVVTLPPATGVNTFTSTNGADVPFVVVVNAVSFGIQIKAAGTDVIQLPGSVSSAGGTQTTTTVGGSVKLFPCDTGKWCTEGAAGGTWTGA